MLLRAKSHGKTGNESNQRMNGMHAEETNRLRAQGDDIAEFCSYVRAERKDPFNIRARTRRGSANSAPSACYIVEMDTILTRGISKGPTLLIFGTDKLDFIHCCKDTPDWKANYATIRLTDHTQTKCIFSTELNAQKRSLSLHIHAKDCVVINDQARDVQTINIRVASEDDLDAILNECQSLGIQCLAGSTRASPKRPRSSSVIIPLDAGEEPVASPSQNFLIPPSTAINPANHRVNWRNESTEIQERLESVPRAAIENGSQSSLTELTRTPTVHETSSPGQKNSKTIIPELAATVRRAPEPSDSPKKGDAEGSVDKAGGCCNNTEITGTKTKGRSSFQTEDNHTEDVPARNTRSRSSLREKPISKSDVLKPIPSNTQESLIFPRRRSRAKLYTAPTKTIVDWDEDLRASDGSIRAQSKEEGDLTSISSPSSSGAPYSLKERLQVSRGGSARKKQPSKANTRDRNRKMGKGKNQTNRQVKLLSPRSEAIQDEPSQSIESAYNPVEDVSADNGKSGNESGVPEEPGSLNSNSRRHKGITVWSDVQSFDENIHGRGQTVAEKLIAALQEHDTPENQSDKPPREHHRDIEPGTKVSQEISEMHGGPGQDVLHAKNKERKVDRQDLPDLPGYTTSRTSHDGIARDEIYPVEIYSDEYSKEEGQNSPLDDDRNQERNLNKRQAMSKGQGKQGIQKSSSHATTSSVESRSTDSTPENHYTSSSPSECYRSYLGQVHMASSTSKLFGIGRPELLPGKEGHSAGSAGQVPSCTDYTSEGITFKEYGSWVTHDDNGGVPYTTNGQEGRLSDDTGRNVKEIDPSTKTVVDKNGSPRLRQPDLWKAGNVARKRQNATPSVEQRRLKRMKGIDQENQDQSSLRATAEDQAKGLDAQGEEDSGMAGCTGTDERSLKFTPALLQQASGESNTTFSPSDRTADRGRRSSFLYRLGRSSRTSGPGLLESTLEKEQWRTYGSKMHGPGTQSSAAGETLVQGALSDQKTPFNVPQSTSQIDWQTSLQELHSGMERTLLSNSEVRHFLQLSFVA